MAATANTRGAPTPAKHHIQWYEAVRHLVALRDRTLDGLDSVCWPEVISQAGEAPVRLQEQNAEIKAVRHLSAVRSGEAPDR